MAKKEVELDFQAFIASIENWDGANPPFDEAVRSALLHAQLMGRGDAFRRELSETLEISGTTISRYAAGVARPMGNVSAMVVRESHKILVALYEQAVKSNNAMVLFMRHVGEGCSDDD